MTSDDDKLSRVALCNILRYIGGNCDVTDKNTELESTDETDDEVELAFSFMRSRFYIRVRKADLARLAGLREPHHD